MGADWDTDAETNGKTDEGSNQGSYTLADSHTSHTDAHKKSNTDAHKRSNADTHEGADHTGANSPADATAEQTFSMILNGCNVFFLKVIVPLTE